MSRFDPNSKDQSKLSAFIDLIFPNREVVIRSGGSVGFYKLSSSRQIVLLGAVSLLVLWTVYATGMYIARGYFIQDSEAEVASAAATYDTLLEQVEQHRDEIASISSDLDRNNAQLADTSDDILPPEEQLQRIEASFEQGEMQSRDVESRDEIVARLKTVADKIKATPVSMSSVPDTGQIMDDPDRDMAEDHARLLREKINLRGRLLKHLKGLAQDVASIALERDSLVALGNPDEIERQKLLLQRNLATKERDEANAQVGDLQAQMADMRDVHSEVLQRFSDFASGSLGDVEKALGTVGLDIKQLLNGKIGGKIGGEIDGEIDGKIDRSGQGGPFIPARVTSASTRGIYTKKGPAGIRATLVSLDVKIGRMENLQQVLHSVPLQTPLDSYRVSSNFGAREDPLNGSLSRHEGLDLAAPIGTSVHATAQGVVVYAGWKSRYGRTVIVEHPMGFKTIYGHMNKILVTKGQKVEAGSKIGQVGSSGRSTGPHLHYEVRVDGKPLNPSRFIKAGRNVLKG